MLLPTNLDATYNDSDTDPTVAAHQQHHDALHAWYNGSRELGSVEVIPTDAITFNSTAYVDVPGLVKTVDIGDRPVWVSVGVMLQNVGTGIPNTVLELSREGTDAYEFYIGGPPNIYMFWTAQVRKRWSLPPGEHTFKVRLRLTNATDRSIVMAANSIQNLLIEEF